MWWGSQQNTVVKVILSYCLLFGLVSFFVKTKCHMSLHTLDQIKLKTLVNASLPVNSSLPLFFFLLPTTQLSLWLSDLLLWSVYSLFLSRMIIDLSNSHCCCIFHFTALDKCFEEQEAHCQQITCLGAMFIYDLYKRPGLYLFAWCVLLG